MREKLFQKARILVIDDEPLMVRAIHDVLTSYGYVQVRGATDTEESLQIFDEYRPDLIILDLVMPGMGGLELLKKLRMVVPPETYLPILIITGKPSSSARLDALEYGASDFITKPFDPLDLNLRVSTLLESRFLHLALARKNSELEARATELDGANRRLREEIVERQQAETLLRDSETMLKTIVESIPAHVFIKDLEGHFLLVNQYCEKSFGLRSEQMVGKKNHDIHPPEIAALLEENDRIAVQCRSAAEFEEVLQFPSGPRTFLSVKVPLLDARGKPYALCGIATDITGRKKAEEDLQQAQKFLYSIVDNIPHMIFVKDAKDLRFVRVNKAGESLLGLSQNEVLGKNDYDLFPSEEAEFFTSKDRMVLRGNRLVDIPEEHIHTSEGVRILRTKKIPIVDDKMEPEYLLGISEDITNQKEAAEALRKSEEKLSLAIAGADLGTWDWDLITGHLVWSERKKEMFAVPTDSEMSMEIFLNSVDESHRPMVTAALDRAREVGDIFDVEYPIHWPDGSAHWIASRGRVTRDADGKPISMSGTAQDVTERKRIEGIVIQAREEAEKANRAKSEFLSRMSHELRTPLNAILGFGQLLEAEDHDPDEADSIEQILKAGRHLLGLINEVLDISRIEAGGLALSLESVPLSEALEEAVGLVRPAAIRCGVTIGEFACDRHVRADQQRLKQIFLNLLSNAIKYNRDGGSVTLSAVERSASILRINVRDTGLGISPEDEPKVFTPFERFGEVKTTVEGIGLGLTISKRLVELMGGAIGFESVPGEGSAFWIELPLAENPLSQVDNDSVPETAMHVLHPCTLLYIEDNLSNLKLIERLLARLPGVKLLAAMQGQIGLDLAREHQPDLIMLDLHLPDINGDVVLGRLLSDPQTSHIPVMMISADATPGQIEKLKAIGACEYLTKPLDVKLFLGALKKSLGELPCRENWQETF